MYSMHERAVAFPRGKDSGGTRTWSVGNGRVVLGLHSGQDRGDDTVASRAGKPEYVQRCGIEVARQGFAQQCARAEETGADGRWREW